MATVNEIAFLMRQFTDESDDSYYSPSDVNSGLLYGIDRFQNIVQSIDENKFTSEVTIYPLGAQDYNLDGGEPVAIFGQTVAPTGTKRCKRIIKLYTPANASGWGGPILWEPVQSIEQLLSRRTVWANMVPIRAGLYFLNNYKLMFPFKVQLPITIIYQAQDRVTGTVGGGYVDDFNQFADLIAMFACEPYFIRNGTSNPALEQRKSERLKELQLFMMQGRDLNNGGRQNILW